MTGFARIAALALCLASTPALVGAQPPPYPPYPAYPPPPPPPPPHVYGPPPGYYPPPPPAVVPPPPLSPVARVIYAPFYAAGLVIRYGFYYAVVAPLEVLGRTIAYGVEGGVDEPPPRRREEPR